MSNICNVHTSHLNNCNSSPSMTQKNRLDQKPCTFLFSSRYYVMYCMYTSLPEDSAGTVKPYCFLSELRPKRHCKKVTSPLESNKNKPYKKVTRIRSGISIGHLVNMYRLGFKFVVQNIVKNKAYLIWELQKCNLNNMAQYIPLGRVPQSTVLHLLLFSHCIPEINIRIPEQIRFLLFL